jgi:hypothetical protein
MKKLVSNAEYCSKYLKRRDHFEELGQEYLQDNAKTNVIVMA